MGTAFRRHRFAALFVLTFAAMSVWSTTGHAEGGAGGFRCYVCD